MIRRLLVVAVMAASTIPLTAVPAQAGIRICRVNTPVIYTTYTRIVGEGTISCIGTASGRLETQCRMQRRYGGFGVYRWVDDYGVSYARTTYAKSCKWSTPRREGRFRVIVRHVTHGDGAIKASGWNQSNAIDVTAP